jgi:hypothetical protein
MIIKLLFINLTINIFYIKTNLIKYKIQFNQK